MSVQQQGADIKKPACPRAVLWCEVLVRGLKNIAFNDFWVCVRALAFMIFTT